MRRVVCPRSRHSGRGSARPARSWEYPRMMQRFLATCIRKVGRGVERLGNRLNRFDPPALPRPPREFTRQESATHGRLEKSYAINGDMTLRMTYDLSPDSVVLDLGGYHGAWAVEIMARYCCHIHIFEPCPQFME